MTAAATEHPQSATPDTNTDTGTATDQPPALAVYVHLPWCVARCPYCDFNAHGLNGRPADQAGYVDALLRDLAFERDALGAAADTPVHSVFFGGGTPSLFSPDNIGRIIDALATTLRLTDDVEITLEANPGTTDAARFAGYRAAGVNRLSIGVQSLDDAQLRRIGRIHDATAAISAVAQARAAGFDNLNLDMMFGLPTQTTAGALTELDALIALAPEHVSWYQLTLEPGTAFARRPPPLPDDDERMAMWDAGRERLADAGFQQYEVSAYARAGHACRHNLSYWRFGDYLGLGAGAHGKWGLQRRARVRRPGAYMAAAGTAMALESCEPIAEADRPLEFLMNALRLTDGFDLPTFTRATGLPADALQPGLDAAVARGTLTLDNGRVAATGLGYRHLDGVLTAFLPDA